MKFRWSIAPSQAVECRQLTESLGLDPLLAQCLLNRDLKEPDDIRLFLNPRLQHLADPFLLPEMERAVDRLFQAREKGETLVIFGDYDVDGVSATALLKEALSDLGWQVHLYLPHRMEEGYGLSQAGVEKCLSQFSPSLFLAVDCGSNAVDAVDWLQGRGIDVVILDHHQVSDPPPRCVALVNPQTASPSGPDFRELCSVGLAFKLVHALVKRGRVEGRKPETTYDIRRFLDLVALGTIADVVPLRGENRILVSAGLERLNMTQRPGLKVLQEIAGIQRRITGYEVGFQLAPRLNAAGRLEDATVAMQLLLAPDRIAAEPLARQLDFHNRQRQEIERQIADQVLQTIRSRFNPERDYVIVEGHSDWHVGVVGIVASRVLQEVYRPTIILGGNGSKWRGSGRSIAGFDLAEALRECDDLLLRHGGHAMAAGLTLDPDQLDALRSRLNALARDRLNPECLQPSLRLDAEVDPSRLTLDQVIELGKLQQTGMGNPPVHLCMRNVTLHRAVQRIGNEKQHAKFWVTDGSAVCEAVWWRAGQAPLPAGRFDLAFSPKLNEFNGKTRVQLSVLDWQPAHTP